MLNLLSELYVKPAIMPYLFPSSVNIEMLTKELVTSRDQQQNLLKHTVAI